MTRGHVPCPVSDRNARGPWARYLAAFRIAIVGLAVVFFWLGATTSPLLADGTITIGSQPAPAAGEDFGQYLADHQSDLAPFFSKNAEDLVKLGVPMLMGMTGWVIIFTMLIGWGVDVLMSRGFAFFFAPAFADIKRSIIYATGRLFLSFVYTCLMGLAIVFSLKLAHAGVVMALVVLLLLVVALAAQIVWILYLYRTDFSVSAFFYLAVVVVHAVVGFLIAKPVIGFRATSVATNFVDQVITPRLQADAESTKHDLAGIQSDRNAAMAKASDFQNQLAQAQAEQLQLRGEIEAKKNSDIYVFSRIVQARARGELESARDQLTAFMSQFSTSPLNALARVQLAQINDQLSVEETQKKQEEAEAAKAEALARADLLSRAAQGQVTLSEMRQALIGKTRAQVGDLLGQPTDTASDSWSYRQQMILNPMTNEKSGLIVNFAEGIVQGVDYNRGGGPQ